MSDCVESGLGHQWEAYKPVDFSRPDWAAVMLSCMCIRDGCGLEKHIYFDWNGNRWTPYYRKPKNYQGRGHRKIIELQFAWGKKFGSVSRGKA